MCAVILRYVRAFFIVLTKNELRPCVRTLDDETRRACEQNINRNSYFDYVLTGSLINFETEVLNKFDLLFSWFYARYNRRYF